MEKFIAYYRVSTTKQGRTGLGMEAQRDSVANYLATTKGELLEEYTEVQSGKKNDRPELEKALLKCKLTGCTLLIAKLDRLSRNASFLLSLKDSNINFVASDMPEAKRLTVGRMAVMAEYESQKISERTTEALRVAKARGVKLGNPRLDEVRYTDTTKANQKRSEKAKEYNRDMLETIKELQNKFDMPLSLRSIAGLLNDSGYTTIRGKAWQATSVMRVLEAV